MSVIKTDQKPINMATLRESCKEITELGNVVLVVIFWYELTKIT